MRCFFWSMCFCILGCCRANEHGNKPIVNAPAGPIMGMKSVYEPTGEAIYEFRGIPFAKPPLGRLRFSKPEPIDKFGRVHDGTKFGFACMQAVYDHLPDFFKAEISEDCLVLNVYVPRNLERNRKLSVMVYIHGGGFILGEGKQYDGSQIAMEGNVIYVAPNYRLGLFGFLAVGHSAARGNYGLWDQKLALQWVHENIEAFGGDQNSVTIFGESAGGFSVSFQSLIPSNQGLFQRVIAQSGVTSRVVFLKRNSIERNVKDLSERTSCSYEDREKFVKCLRELSADNLVQVTNTFGTEPSGKLKYDHISIPVIDGELYPEHPLISVADETSQISKFFRSLDFIAGTVSTEGSLVFMQMPVTPGFLETYKMNITEGIKTEAVCEGMVSPFVDAFYEGDVSVKRKLCTYYSADSLAAQSKKAMEFHAFANFYWSTAEMLDLHTSERERTYQYVVTKPSPIPIMGPTPSWFSGCGHGEELIYFFNVTKAINPHLNVEFTESEKDLSNKLISYWTSFAKTG